MVEQRASPPSGPAWGRIILLASLGLNLFFAGWMVGGRMLWRPGPHGPMQGLSERLRQSLSPDGARLVEGLVQDLAARNAERAGVLEPLRRKVKSVLATEPFDRDAFAQALADLNAAAARDRGEMNKRIAEVIAQLSAEDRKRLVDLRLPPPFPGRGQLPDLWTTDRPPPPR